MISGIPDKLEFTSVSGAAGGNPTFNWTADSNAVYYDVWIDNLSTGESRVFRDKFITTNSVTLAETLASGNYRVWVRGWNAAEQQGAWSDRYDFTVAATDIEADPNMNAKSSELLLDGGVQLVSLDVILDPTINTSDETETQDSETKTDSVNVELIANTQAQQSWGADHTNASFVEYQTADSTIDAVMAALDSTDWLMDNSVS